MRFLLAGLCALGIWASDVLPASAAWNNVFQPTLFCRNRQSTSQYTPPSVVYSVPVVAAPTNCCTPAPVVAPSTCYSPPQTSCSTSYVQRCYYQPVTTYQSQSYYEPVTSYQTSYYYEPVVSYRYSYYYDPCSCGYQQVATPTTSYQLRSQSCPVQSWVQRCAQVPVTTYQKSFYWQPQTTCCQTTVGAPVLTSAPAAPCCQQPPQVTAAPSAPAPSAPPPVVNENRTPGTGSGNGGGYDRYYPPSDQQKIQPVPATPGASWQPAPGGAPGTPIPSRPILSTPVPATPAVKLERIVFGADSSVEGQVVRSDNTPRPEAKVLFVSADQPNVRETVRANDAGRFQVTLASGGWLVYLHGPDGNPIFHSRIDVNEQQPAHITLVNR